ncbi:MAG: two-component system response regulator [Pseudomonadota bacterium]|jgi:two-component system OmpR family response regulator
MRILTVENETKLNKVLKDGLSELGYQTDDAESIKDALYFVSIRNYDLVMLNWQIDDGDPVELIAAIKSKSTRTAVILTSDSSDYQDEIDGLQSGADDFIVKPYDFDILVARVEARLRFGGSNVIKIADMIIDHEEERVLYRGTEVDLKGKPFDVLFHLARYRDQIISKEQLLDAIWEEPELVTPNVIEVAINQIRQKMDKPLGISTIETVRRRGYRFCYPRTAIDR